MVCVLSGFFAKVVIVPEVSLPHFPKSVLLKEGKYFIFLLHPISNDFR